MFYFQIDIIIVSKIDSYIIIKHDSYLITQSDQIIKLINSEMEEYFRYSLICDLLNRNVYMLQRICGTRYFPESLTHLENYGNP